jgi:hypothetical protein
MPHPNDESEPQEAGFVKRNWVVISFLAVLAVIGGMVFPFVPKNGADNDYLVVSSANLNITNPYLNQHNVMVGMRNKTKVVRKFDEEMKAKFKIIRAKSEIYQFWDVRNYPKFLETMHIPEETWLTYKYKFIDLILNHKDDNSTSFVIGFSGSSVTAGHDNFFNQSYPAVVERTLRPVFTELGIRLVVSLFTFDVLILIISILSAH